MKDNQTAKQEIKTLLSNLNIKKVIFVDDEYSRKIEVADFIGLVFEAKDKNIESLLNESFHLNDEDLSDDDIISQKIRSRWEKINDRSKEQIQTELMQKLGRYNDYEHLSKLKTFFPGNKFHGMPPDEWLKKYNALIPKANTTDCILCLFDQDLSKTEGFSDTGSKSGIGLLSNLLEKLPKNEERKVICGILSHTLSMDSEIDMWRRFASENELESKDFLPLAKKRLENPADFVDGLRKTVLNLHCERIKSQTADVIKKATDNALKELKNLHVYDFSEMVLASSLKEGVWEMDTLLRIFSIFHLDETKERVLDISSVGHLKSDLQTARKIFGKKGHIPRGQVLNFFQDADSVSKEEQKIIFFL